MKKVHGRKPGKSRSLRNKILVSLINIILIQTLICTSVIFFSGAPGRLDESTMQVLSNTVEGKGTSLRRYFAGITDISLYYDTVSRLISREAVKRNLSVAEYTSDAGNRYTILERVTPTVLSALRESGATSCFLILENETGSSKKDAIYLRDLNPQETPENNEDIYVEAGYSNLLYKYNFTLDSHWSAQLDVGENCPFYQISYDAGNYYKDIEAEGLGYFGQPCRIHPQDIEVITYTVPLLDENHESYGVLGFGLSLNYLARLLPQNEITIDGDGSFYLGVTEDFRQVSNVLVSNNAKYSALKSGTASTLRCASEEYGIYHLSAGKLLDEVSVGVYPLNLYGNNSPFENQQWILCGIVRDSALYGSSRLMNTIVIWALISSVIVALIGTHFLSRGFARPIQAMVTGIREMMPGYGKLPRTGILEFDGIEDVIEKQNVSIFRAGGKMADIIEASNIMLGVCDYSVSEDTLFCTHKVFDILGISDEGWKNNYISLENFEKRAAVLSCYFERSREDKELFSYRRPGRPEKWINIKELLADGGKLYILHDVTRSMQEKEKIMHDRDYDVLTNLYNRRAFAREMTYLVDGGHCQNGILSVWDLDNLKYANDTYGHDIGDKYICALAGVFQKRQDMKSVCARLSGDEFAFFVYDAPQEEMSTVLEDLHRAFMQRRLSTPDGGELSVSASMGMASYTEDAVTYAELSKRADFAMYQVKKSSKGACRAFDEEDYLRDYILVQGVGEISRIVKEEAIRYAFQPIVSMTDRRVIAYEALMRPDSDLLGRPDVFLRVAENESRLGQVEHMTWFLALKAFFEQLRPGDEAKLFINSISNQVLSKQDMQRLEELYGEKLGSVVMEITESTRGQAECEAVKREFCSRWKIPIALDDYGSGYSNSDVLLSRCFNYAKLDMSLIRNIHQNPATCTLVTGMIDFSHANGLLVIAEGIETEAEYQKLLELGADYGQGFYFARPDFSLYRE